jgi:hypothetical protein
MMAPSQPAQAGRQKRFRSTTCLTAAKTHFAARRGTSRKEAGVPEYSIVETQYVQHLGQSPAEIGQQLAEVMQRAADATRIALECRIEAARLLLIVQEQHGYKGKRYAEFAMANGVSSRSDAFDMLLLNEADDDVLAAPEATADPYHEYPSWRQIWARIKHRKTRKARHWLIPPPLYAELDAEFHFDHDPYPYTLPDGFNALSGDWGKRNWVNPNFRASDGVGGKGATAGVRKGIEQQGKGNLSVFVLPVHDYVTTLLEAGAEIRPLGRVAFLDVESGRPAPHPPNVALFILRPTHPVAVNDNFPAGQTGEPT